MIVIGLAIATVLGLRATGAFDPSPTPGGTALTGVEPFDIPERSHVDGAVPYPQLPPAGGNHAPRWQNCGFYTSPIVKENGVHTLEHGAAWITYGPSVPPAQIEQLRQLARSQTYVLVTPYADLPSPIVATVWGRQLRLNSADDPQLREFIRVFRLGPTTPEPGAPCTGGLGQPQ